MSDLTLLQDLTLRGTLFSVTRVDFAKLAPHCLFRKVIFSWEPEPFFIFGVAAEIHECFYECNCEIDHE
ncbi:hypothetical protein HNP81_002035 [Peribacillus huizhouensis]|uniref:Uncharacterized protein n=1 Tax=Peribacillus huizhouensis TaxID=1501239 RepID=A0ABR6CP48_9BACI|nr:hypothetical protein [Peribacillus huizhouensis]